MYFDIRYLELQERYIQNLNLSGTLLDVLNIFQPYTYVPKSIFPCWG